MTQTRDQTVLLTLSFSFFNTYVSGPYLCPLISEVGYNMIDNMSGFTMK